MKQLILGGARSGKSALAERLACDTGMPVLYVATARAEDQEMTRRIALHRQRRPAAWETREEPLRLASLLQREAEHGRCILVDCLTLWLSNLLLAEDTALLEREREALVQLVPTLPGELIMVSNEVGLGIVPMGALARRFQDEAGWLHQMLADRCERVVFTIAGLPQILKGEAL